MDSVAAFYIFPEAFKNRRDAAEDAVTRVAKQLNVSVPMIDDNRFVEYGHVTPEQLRQAVATAVPENSQEGLIYFPD